MVKNFDDAFSRFETNHACDRRTDDGIGVAYTRYSIYAVARKITGNEKHAYFHKT